MILVHENPTTDFIIMFNDADCVDKCLGRPGMFHIMGTNTLVTKLSAYPSCALHS
jgi:hypothetical protein